MRLGITARSITLTLLSFAAVSAAIWIGLLVNAVSLETRIARDWMALVEKCRASIEAGVPLDTSGLQPAEIVDIMPGMGTILHQRVSAFPDGRYAIVEREFAARDGVERACAVRIADYRNGPTKREAAVLFYDFAQLAHGLFEAETHWGAEILAGPQFAAHAFEPREPRSEGCMVKTSVAVFLETHDVIATTSEMPGCSGPSFLSGETV